MDIVAFVFDASEVVGDKQEFCFYNQSYHPTESVELSSILRTSDTTTTLLDTVRLFDDRRMRLAILPR